MPTIAEREKRLHDLLHNLQEAATALSRHALLPCVDDGEGCVTRLEHKRPRQGFHDLPPGEMCDACAAYWHASCASARLIFALKRGLHEKGAIPPCAASMGCLCAGHARGNAADAPCDTSEVKR